VKVFIFGQNYKYMK